jgi:hypothetical protein
VRWLFCKPAAQTVGCDGSDDCREFYCGRSADEARTSLDW